jgi:hypothetical protein
VAIDPAAVVLTAGMHETFPVEFVPFTPWARNSTPHVNATITITNKYKFFIKRFFGLKGFFGFE